MHPPLIDRLGPKDAVLGLLTIGYLHTQEVGRLGELFTDDVLDFSACAKLFDEVLTFARSHEYLNGLGDEQLDPELINACLPEGIDGPGLAAEMSEDFALLLRSLAAEDEGISITEDVGPVPVRIGSYVLTLTGARMTTLLEKWSGTPEGAAALTHVLSQEQVTEDDLCHLFCEAFAWVIGKNHPETDDEGPGQLTDYVTSLASELSHDGAALGPDFIEALDHRLRNMRP